MQPLISILVPVFNRKDFLTETIESVLQQTSANWELILVDDGSTDGALEVCRSYAEKHENVLLVQRQGEKKGGSVCRNLGAKHAKGNYLIFLDSDDLLSKECIAQRSKTALAHPELDLLIFPMLLFHEQVDDMRILQNIPTPENDLDRFLRRENVWLVSQPLWKKNAFQSVGGFSEDYLSFQDWEMNVKALIHNLSYRFFHELPPDNYYRQHEEGSVSSARYSPAHILSNAEMILATTMLLSGSGKFNEARRRSLAAFFVDVLLRYRFAEHPKQYLNTFRDLLAKAVESGLLFAGEAGWLNKYLLLHLNPLAFRSKFFRTFTDATFRGFIFRKFGSNAVSNQVKHKYDGIIT